MRLIDADALLGRIPNLYERRQVGRWVDEAPTVDAVPARRGKWDDIGGIIRWGCPFCHHAYDVKTKFCPNCGADMRGERHEVI